MPATALVPLSGGARGTHPSPLLAPSPPSHSQNPNKDCALFLPSMPSTKRVGPLSSSSGNIPGLWGGLEGSSPPSTWSEGARKVQVRATSKNHFFSQQRIGTVPAHGVHHLEGWSSPQLHGQYSWPMGRVRGHPTSQHLNKGGEKMCSNNCQCQGWRGSNPQLDPQTGRGGGRGLVLASPDV